MKKITPYKTLKGALKALDNGGRFYNLFTKADDRVIESSELYKAAGVVGDKTKALLFFEMALAGLGESERRQVLTHLDNEIKALRRSGRPRRLQVSGFAGAVSAGKSAIVEGYPRFIRDKSDFVGFVMIPIVAGNITTFSMVPIYQQYDLYEVYEAAGQGEKLVVAAAKGSKKLEERLTAFGGVVKVFKTKKTDKSKTPYLEAAYYI